MRHEVLKQLRTTFQNTCFGLLGQIFAYSRTLYACFSILLQSFSQSLFENIVPMKSVLWGGGN